jgi:hypothetical protein
MATFPHGRRFHLSAIPDMQKERYFGNPGTTTVRLRGCFRNPVIPVFSCLSETKTMPLERGFSDSETWLTLDSGNVDVPETTSFP